MNKKVSVKTVVVGFIVFAFIAFILFPTGSDNNQTSQESNSSSSESSSVKEESSVESSEVADYNQSQDDSFENTNESQPSTNEKIENARIILSEAFENQGVIRYESNIKSFVMTPTDPQLLKEISDTIEGTKDPQDWIGMVEQNKQMSNSITQALGYGYSFVIENPYSAGDMIYAVKDGEVIYDGVAETAGFSY